MSRRCLLSAAATCRGGFGLASPGAFPSLGAEFVLVPSVRLALFVLQLPLLLEPRELGLRFRVHALGRGDVAVVGIVARPRLLGGLFVAAG